MFSDTVYLPGASSKCRAGVRQQPGISHICGWLDNVVRKVLARIIDCCCVLIYTYYTTRSVA